MKVIHLACIVSVLLLVGSMAMIPADALKGEGVYTKKFGKDTAHIVCGDKLCSDLDESQSDEKFVVTALTLLGSLVTGVVSSVINYPIVELIYGDDNDFEGQVISDLNDLKNSINTIPDKTVELFWEEEFRNTVETFADKLILYQKDWKNNPNQSNEDRDDFYRQLFNKYDFTGLNIFQHEPIHDEEVLMYIFASNLYINGLQELALVNPGLNNTNLQEVGDAEDIKSVVNTFSNRLTSATFTNNLLPGLTGIEGRVGCERENQATLPIVVDQLISLRLVVESLPKETVCLVAAGEGTADEIILCRQEFNFQDPARGGIIDRVDIYSDFVLTDYGQGVCLFNPQQIEDRKSTIADLDTLRGAYINKIEHEQDQLKEWVSFTINCWESLKTTPVPTDLEVENCKDPPS